MGPDSPQRPDFAFDRMWAENREYLARLLTRLSGDAELAQDLLQETCLRALQGIAHYRGGDPKAWLAAIARNVFLAHERTRHARAQRPLEDEVADDRRAQIGSEDYIALLSLRSAVSDLAEPFRAALVMKHYCGFSYQEIARHQNCPVGTAKRRVWTAVQRLRSALGVIEEEVLEMKCVALRGTRMLDYLYGVLPADDAARVKKHLEECPECRQEAAELRKVVGVLDAAMQLQRRYGAASVITEASGAPVEILDKLGRLMERIAAILQADKCVFLRLDARSGELVAERPACGLSDEELESLRVSATEGLSGEVIREGKPRLVSDGAQFEEPLRSLGVRNGICSPVAFEERAPDEGTPTTRTLGVLYVLDKVRRGSFVDEDTQLLLKIAPRAGAIIAEAQAFSDAARRRDQLAQMIEDFLGAVPVGPATEASQQSGRQPGTLGG